ncbi:MAG: sulfite exporter TauE/SafE family protein [Candidatus Fimivivens sp.]
MTPIATFIFLLTCAAGATIQTTTGFGFGVLCMAVFPYILPSYLQATAVSSICAAIMSSIVAIQCRKYINFKIILPLLIGYSVASVWSVQYAKTQAEGFMVKLLGAVLILVSIYFIFFSGKIRIKPTFINGLVAGMIGGVGSGMFSIGGPPVIIYLTSAISDKDEYRACSLTYFAIGSWYVSAARWLNGASNMQTVYLSLMAIAALFVGTYIGNRIFNRINAATLKRLVYCFMAVSGVTMLF